MTANHDVVICGGGLAGLLLARQLRREFNDLSVAVLEKTTRPLPDACHKVGESSVELGSQYLESLGLGEYLLERQLVKFGLRFFPGGGHLPLEQRTEIGPCAEPIVRSYQLDRGRLEEDLRGFIEKDGVTLIEGARVRGVELGSDEPHEISFMVDGEKRSLTARWLVDATGRAAVLRKKMKLTRGTRHAASASWFRVAGRIDINDLVEDTTKWNTRPGAENRWLSTNHLMGAGYWVWLIPLSTGNTSVGIVVHDEMHEFSAISSLEKSKAWLAEHEPVIARALEQAEVKDFLCLKGYSHGVSRGWSKDRWAIVGEAGAFVDPLYSPGTDFIAIANGSTTEMIRADLAGEDLVERAAVMNTNYKAFVNGALDIFRYAAPVYGHPRAMSAKVFWDDFVYWSFTAQFFLQSIYKLPVAAQKPYTVVGGRILDLTTRMQRFFRAWAELSPPIDPEATFRSVPSYPSVLVDLHLELGERISPEEALAAMTTRAEQSGEIAGEIVLRAVQELGPELGRRILDEADFASWDAPISAERLVTEGLAGQTRRRGLSEIARDVERTLGRVRRHESAAAARELFTQSTPA